jgi:cell wall assembly regulator SMI1
MNPFETHVNKVKKLAGIYKKILNKGASDSAVKKFQKAIKLDVPADLIDFYKVCNGAKDDEIVDIQYMIFLSLDRVADLKKMFDKILDEKQEDGDFFCWHKDWVPFADDQDRVTIFIDTTGKATGIKGGVLDRSRDTFEGDDLLLIAPSFKAFIEGWVKRVEEEQIYFLSENEDDDNNDPVEDGYFEHESRTFVPFKGANA